MQQDGARSGARAALSMREMRHDGAMLRAQRRLRRRHVIRLRCADAATIITLRRYAASPRRLLQRHYDVYHQKNSIRNITSMSYTALLLIFMPID